MAQYNYRPLDVTKRDIRILHLQPGARNDPISIAIEHKPFEPIRHDEPWRISNEWFRTIQKKLPERWVVYRTLEGRPLFRHAPENGAAYTSWQPPDPEWNKECGSATNPSSYLPLQSNFEAASYTWGSQTPVFTIKVSDYQSASGPSRTLGVGSNLHTMLRYLRKPYHTRILWIDAISINQEDALEKSAQIQMMGDIFASARRVVMWLGEHSDDSAEALETLSYIGSQLEHTVCGRTVPSPQCKETNWWDPTYRIPLSSKTWNAIALLMLRPYFERLWIIQEVQLANIESLVHCGDSAVPWYYVRRAFLRCRIEMAILHELSSTSRSVRLSLTDHMARDLRGFDAKWLFAIATSRKCSDPRDKVFAILGMLSPLLAQCISTRYDLSAAAVYIDLLVASVSVTHRLRLLGWISDHDESSIPDRPTWAANLTQSIYERFRLFGTSLASGQSAASISFAEPDQLHVRGKYYDKVNSIAPSTTGTIKTRCEAFVKLAQGYLPHATKQDLIDSFMWVLTQGHLRDRWTHAPLYPFLEEARALVDPSNSGIGETLLETHGYWYQSAIANHPPGRMFVTCKGHLGCGPTIVQPGDKVCILLGYDDPVLLRPTTPRTQAVKYQVVGPSYVHGLMEGQAILGTLPNSWDMIIHHLRGHEILFSNRETGDTTRQDPRLDLLPKEWEEIFPSSEESEAQFRYVVQHYRNKQTGELLDSDPRLLPDALGARGIDLETFTLV